MSNAVNDFDEEKAKKGLLKNITEDENDDDDGKVKCPKCDEEMEEKGFIRTGRPVMGQSVKGTALYQCENCKNVELR